MKTLITIIILMMVLGCSNFTCPPYKEVGDCIKGAEREHADCMKLARGANGDRGSKIRCKEDFEGNAKRCRTACR